VAPLIYKAISQMHLIFSMESNSSKNFVARGGHSIRRLYEYYCSVNNISLPFLNTISMSRLLVLVSIYNKDSDFFYKTISKEIGFENAKKIILEIFLKPGQLNQLDVSFMALIDPSISFDEYKLAPEFSLFDVFMKKLSVHYENYVKSQFELINFDKVFIVDTGWSGSIQFMLNKYYNLNSFGIYLGRSFPMKSEDVRVESVGLIFDSAYTGNIGCI
jgi:hypothetical protein